MDTSGLRLVAGSGPPALVRLQSAPLGTGADGSVYACDSHPELVVKLYHEPERDPERSRKLLAMVQAPPALDPVHHGGHRYVQLTWPTHLVRDAAGRFRGFAMPRVEMRRAVLLEALLSRKSRRAYQLPEAYGLRVTAARNLAAVIEALHARGHHVIDLKPVNTYVYRETFFVALLDCDGFSVQSPSGRFPAHQYTQDYIAPEALLGKRAPEELGEAQDRFALAVIVFQLLNGGVHPFQGVPAQGLPVPPTTGERIMRWMYAYGRRGNPLLRPSPWSVHEAFDNPTRDLFDRAFGSEPAARPSAAEWRAHLARYADPSTGALKRCAHDPSHAYYAAAPNAGCFQCEREGVRAQAVRDGRLPPEPAPAPARPPAPPPGAPTPPPGLVVPPTPGTYTPPARPGGMPAGTPAPARIRRVGPHPLATPRETAEWVVAFVIVVAVVVIATWMLTNRPPAVAACPVAAKSAAPRDSLTVLVELAARLSSAGDFDALEAAPFGYADARGRTALHRAVMEWHSGGAMGLVMARANLDPRDRDGVTPLMMASGRAARWYTILLLTNGADPNLRNAAGQTALMYAVMSCPTLQQQWGSSQSAEAESAVLKYFVDGGADLDAQDERGMTALMHATRGSGLWVRALLEAGADPFVADKQGRNVFHHAVNAPASRGRDYTQALLRRVAQNRGWAELPAGTRAQILTEVDTRRGLGTAKQRDQVRRPAAASADSVGLLLPIRP